MIKKLDKSKQEKIHNIVKNIFIKNDKRINKDGMFAQKSHTVGLRITRIF